MSIPVYESSVEALENLDFNIGCSGKIPSYPIERGDNAAIPCENAANWIIIYDCGCHKVKCNPCFKALLVRHSKIQEAGRVMYCSICKTEISFDYTINSI